MNDTAGRERRAAALSNDELIEQYSVAMTRVPWNHPPHRRQRQELRAELRRRLESPTDAASAAAGVSGRPDGPVSLQEALQLATRAAELIDEAVDLLHQITTGRDYTCQHPEWRLPDAVTDRSYRADKAARDARMDIVCNYAGLIDTIQREIAAAESAEASGGTGGK